MKQANQPTRMADRLLEPNNGLLRAGAAVVVHGAVFGFADGVPRRRHGDCDEEGVGGAGDEGEERRFGEGVDVVEGEGGGET